MLPPVPPPTVAAGVPVVQAMVAPVVGGVSSAGVLGSAWRLLSLRLWYSFHLSLLLPMLSKRLRLAN